VRWTERNRERGLKRFIEPTGGDELMAPSAIYDHSAVCAPMQSWPIFLTTREAPRAGESLTAAQR